MLITEPTAQGPVGLLARPEQEDAPGFFRETVPAAFRQDNTVGSLLAQERVEGPFLSDYDPFAHIDGYEDYARSFVGATSQEQVDAIKRQIDREIKDRETLAQSGWLGTAASIAAGTIDPIILLPVGGVAARGASRGVNLLAGGLATARAGLLGATAAETLLHTTQEVRTFGESAANIAAATFLSGVLGAGAGALARPLASRVEADLTVPVRPVDDPYSPGFVQLTEEDLRLDTAESAADLINETLDDPNVPIDLPEQIGEGGSVGAAAVTRTEARLKSALGVERATRWQSPMLRTATSVSVETRRVAQELVETPFTYEENALGVASPIPVEARVRAYNAPLAEAITEMDRLFVKYRTGRTEPGMAAVTRIQGADLLGSARRERKMTYHEFREAVGRAMRRNDTHEIPEVAEAAKAYRRRVFDPLKERAIANGLLPEDVKVETAPSYLSRVWNTTKINARRPDLVRITMQWLQRQHPDLSAVELEDVAQQIIDTLLTTPAGRIRYEAIPIKNAPSLKERTFSIPDEMVEDFLESDVELIARFYTRTLAPDVELAERFGRPDMTDQLDRIIEDYARKQTNAKTDRERLKLARRREEDLRDIGAMRDRLRGTYAAPSDPNGLLSRSVRAIKQLNYIRMLGGMTLAAIPDLARPVMVEGVMRTVGDGIVPLVRNLKGFRLAAKEVKLAGTALDMTLDTRALSLADMGDDFGRHTKFERGLQQVANNFGVVSLMSPWNAALKQFSGVIVSNRVLEHSARWGDGKLGKAGIERLAAAGINKTMAARIARQFNQFGQEIDGVRIANTEAWTDTEAVRTFRAAIARETDKIIVTPGIGDRPLMMSQLLGSPELAQLVFQFRGFAFASAQRVAIAGLQQRDAAVLNGFLLSVGLGMLSYFIRVPLSGYEFSDDPRVWVAEGVDRSGVMGWLFDVNNIAEKATRGQVGVNALVGGPQMTRYASRNVWGAILGPTMGTGDDLFRVTGGLATGEWNEGDTRALRRLVPYQNLFYLRWLLDQAEEGVNRELGIR